MESRFFPLENSPKIDCLDYYNNRSDGLDLNQIMGYFLDSKDSLVIKVKSRWTA
jgi:hypothetical protein